jgi:DNA-binding transcriptional LysR family regulator
VRLVVVSTAKYFVPRLLARFLQARPGVDFRMTIHNREEILDELRGNAIDFAIMGRPPEGIDCVARAFAPNPLGIVASPGHRLARKRRIAPAELASEPFIVREPGSGTRAAMERYFGAHRVKWRASMEMASNESIKHTVRNELAEGRIVALAVEGLPVQREWYAVRRTSRRLVPAAEEFGEFLVRESRALLEAEGPLPGAPRQRATRAPRSAR